ALSFRLHDGIEAHALHSDGGINRSTRGGVSDVDHQSLWQFHHWWRRGWWVVMEVKGKTRTWSLRIVHQQVVQVAFHHLDGTAVGGPYAGAHVVLGGVLAQAAHRVKGLVIARDVAPHGRHLLRADLIAEVRHATFKEQEINVVLRVRGNDVEGEQRGDRCPEEVPYRMVLTLQPLQVRAGVLLDLQDIPETPAGPVAD